MSITQPERKTWNCWVPDAGRTVVLHPMTRRLWLQDLPCRSVRLQYNVEFCEMDFEVDPEFANLLDYWEAKFNRLGHTHNIEIALEQSDVRMYRPVMVHRHEREFTLAWLNRPVNLSAKAEDDTIEA